MGEGGSFFIVPFPLIRYRIMFFLLLLYLNWVVISSCTVSPKVSVMGCDSSLGGGWMIFHIGLLKSILYFVNYVSLVEYAKEES